jgi:hypothetical protein
MLFIATNIKLKFIEYPKILNFLKLYLLAVISIFIFYNNSIYTNSWITNQILIFTTVVILWVIILTVLKKKINFKLSLISKFFEMMFMLSVILFGIQSQITFYVLSITMLDFFYTITFLSITNYFNKKYTH